MHTHKKLPEKAKGSRVVQATSASTLFFGGGGGGSSDDDEDDEEMGFGLFDVAESASSIVHRKVFGYTKPQVEKKKEKKG